MAKEVLKPGFHHTKKDELEFCFFFQTFSRISKESDGFTEPKQQTFSILISDPLMPSSFLCEAPALFSVEKKDKKHQTKQMNEVSNEAQDRGVTFKHCVRVT